MSSSWARVEIETSTSGTRECAKIGNADNVAGNEIVSGGAGGYIDMYKYSGGSWSRTVIDSTLSAVTVYDLVIADVDNTGGNKIAAALSNNTIFMYEWTGSAWDRSIVSTAVDDDGSAIVLDLSVGDADNQGDGNKIVASTDSGEVVMFEWSGSLWSRTEICDSSPKPVYNVDVADCDNDGNTEVTVIDDRKHIHTYYYSGIWAKESDVDSIVGVLENLDVGNADNLNSKNKIVVCTNTDDIYMYEWTGSIWSKTDVTTGGAYEIYDIKIGDVYNDGYNSIVSGNSDQDVITYTWSVSSWDSSTIDDAVGGSVLEVTFGDADNDADNEIVICEGSDILMYEQVTWESYRDSGHETVWGTVADPYDSTYHTVYMYGDGFIASQSYYVGYYDGNGDKKATESATGSALSCQYDCTTDPTAQYGTWHAVVFKGASPPSTYAACSGTAGYTTEDDFEVSQTAIPEFPTVLAAIAVCLLCAVAYIMMRRGKKC